MTDRVCKDCHKKKDITEFRERKKNGKPYHETRCILCAKSLARLKYKENISWHRDYCKANKKKKQEYNKKYYSKNREKLLSYRGNRREKDLTNLKHYNKNRRKKDPSFKLRAYVSNSIGRYLIANGSSKKGESILKYLPYTIEELRLHIESLFEAWMSWDNYGRYSINWDENNQVTWTWQLDHIVPHSMLPYDSFEHPNFLKCWALDNLRPLSAKQNIIDGASRVRHKYEKYE
jgi:hypothetical protein